MNKYKYLLTQIIVLLTALLFVYTSASKYLDIHKFVFQMSLVPVPIMQWAAPTLGWLLPTIEMLIFAGFVTGIYRAHYQVKSLYAAVILLSVFELYITVMLLSGLPLGCTCGGLISSMGWGEHLFLNGFFIVAGSLSIRYLQKHQSSKPIIKGDEPAKNNIKALQFT